MSLITRAVSSACLFIAFFLAGVAVEARESAWIVQLKPSVSSDHARAQLSHVIGREIKISKQYVHVINGFSAAMSGQEAQLMRQHPSVLAVAEDQKLQLLIPPMASEQVITDSHTVDQAGSARDPGAGSGDPVIDLIRADELWDGSATNDAGHLGEGIIIGVTGTGISGNHPMFAATGDDGYTHVNPFGDGVYLGECFQTPDLVCNSKLIGRYTFADTSFTSEEPEGASNWAAGQAAGNRMSGEGATSLGVPLITGVAPHANLIIYRTCETSCLTSNILSAFEQAISDGVDVLVHFIGSSVGSPWDSIYAQAALALRESGVSVAYVTGNGGPAPGSLSIRLAAPWVATFTKSTHGRGSDLKVLTGFEGGDTSPPGDLVGGSLGGLVSAGIVYAGHLDVPVPDAALCLEPFPPDTLNGEILVCDRGHISRVQKALNARDSGAGGFVLANVTGGSDSVNSDVFAIPGIHINAANSELLREWLNSGTGHVASIVLNDAPINPELADRLFVGSSRGPLLGLDYLVPSAAVPSVDVLAPTGVDGYRTVIGIASAAGGGALALLKSARPTWTDAELLSALMTTGIAPLSEQDDDAATTPFDHGGGRIDIAAAVQAGLVLDETQTGFSAADPGQGGVPSRMNVAGLVDLNCLEQCQWTRTLRATRSATWSVVAETGSEDVQILVAPKQFSLEAGDEQELQVTFALGDGIDGAYNGSVVLIPDAVETSVTRLMMSVEVQGDDDLDGVANVHDNCLLIANPAQRDSDGDAFGNPCDTDLTNDGITNFVDLAEFAQSYQSGDKNADFNGDGKVDFLDLDVLREFFLQIPGPSGLIQN